MRLYKTDERDAIEKTLQFLFVHRAVSPEMLMRKFEKIIGVQSRKVKRKTML